MTVGRRGWVRRVTDCFEEMREAIGESHNNPIPPIFVIILVFFSSEILLGRDFCSVRPIRVAQRAVVAAARRGS